MLMRKVEPKRSLYDAPKDGTPVYLVFSDAVGEWVSLARHKFERGRWVSCETGLPVTSQLAIIGWRKPAEHEPPSIKGIGTEASPMPGKAKRRGRPAAPLSA